MTVPVFISAEAINRIVKDLYGSAVLPEVEGQLGRSSLMHICYRFRLSSPPSVETDEQGMLLVRAPVEGSISIPWGLGKRFRLEAVAGLGLGVADGQLWAEVGNLIFEDMRIGEGCSLPKEVLALIGPFVRGAVFQGRSGPDGRIYIDLPTLDLPLSGLMEGAPPVEVTINDITVVPQGVVALIGLGSGDDIPPMPLPSPEGRDAVLVISEPMTERLITMVLEGMGDIKGGGSFDVPDHRLVADLFIASAETLTTLGRRGLGRRALKSSSRVEYNFSATTGKPNVTFLEGGKIVLSDLPAHVKADAGLEMDMNKEGILSRIRSLFRPPSKRAPPNTEEVSVGKWDFDQDIKVDRAEVTIEKGVGPDLVWKVADLDLEIDLPWPLPDETIEKIVETIGKSIVSDRLPGKMPEEIPLSEDLPFTVKLSDMDVSTTESELIIRTNIGLLPNKEPEEARRLLMVKVREILPPVLQEGLK
ncbi:MAG: hypothetical protein ISF22_02945 [Methanomassiliicoccus sp.]|nr:hypothetical protein [Methanomassiliicoccus sp.]